MSVSRRAGGQRLVYQAIELTVLASGTHAMPPASKSVGDAIVEPRLAASRRSIAEPLTEELLKGQSEHYSRVEAFGVPDSPPALRRALRRALSLSVHRHPSGLWGSFVCRLGRKAALSRPPAPKQVARHQRAPPAGLWLLLLRRRINDPRHGRQELRALVQLRAEELNRGGESN